MMSGGSDIRLCLLHLGGDGCLFLLPFLSRPRFDGECVYGLSVQPRLCDDGVDEAVAVEEFHPLELVRAEVEVEFGAIAAPREVDDDEVEDSERLP